MSKRKIEVMSAKSLFVRSAPAVLFLLPVLALFGGHADAVSSGSVDRRLCQAVNECKRRLDLGKKCKILPVPKNAVVPAFPPGKFELIPLRKGVWAYNDGAYFSLILKMGERLAMLDIPDSAGSNKPDGSMTRLTDAAEQILNGTIPKRIDIVYSHAHFDHIGGTSRFYNYMKVKYPSALMFIWGTEESGELIEKSVSKRAVIPNVTVGKAGRTLSLGNGLNVKMMIVGGHTANDLVLYIPRYKKEAGVVLYVDVVFPGWSPPFFLAITSDVGQYIRAQKEVLKLDFDVFVGGHFLLGDRSDVMTNLEFTEDLIDAAKAAVEEVTPEILAAAGIGKFSDPNAREFGNVLFAFAAVTRQLQTDACYRILLERWGCRLAGLDISGPGHCFTAITYLLVEY